MRKLFLWILCIVLSFALYSCQSSEKQMVLNKNVKAVLNKAENNAVNLNKIKEFDMDSLDNEPVYWKDDDNFVTINSIDRDSQEYIFYNINIATGEKTKIGSLNNAYILNGLYWKFSSIGNTETRIPFIRDFKLFIYDIATNSSKEISDLSEEKAEIEEKYKDCTIERRKDSSGKFISSVIHPSTDKGNFPPFKIEYPSDLFCGFSAGFINGDKNYLYTVSPSYIRIIDLNTLSVTKIPRNIYSNGFSDNGIQGIVYSKLTNSFYLADATQDYDKASNDYGVLFEFNLLNPSHMKIIKKIPGLSFENSQVSQDGRYIYFSTYKQNTLGNLASSATDSVMELDAKTTAFTNLFENKSKDSYEFYNYNYKYKVIFYDYLNTTDIDSSDKIFGIGNINDNKLNFMENLTPPALNGLSNGGTTNIIFNETGDKFIYRIHYYGNHNVNKGKTTIYQLKNN